MRNEGKMIITMFDDVFAATKKEFEVTWDQVVSRIEDPKVWRKKEVMPLIKLASFGDQKTDQDSYRHDSNVIEVYGVEGDYDDEKVSMEEAAKMLEQKGVKCVLFSSPRYTDEKPRWRILAPFSHEREPEERLYYTELLNGAIGGILAKESFTLSQTYYFGKCTNSYKYIVVDGDCIDTKDGQWDPIRYEAKKELTKTGSSSGIEELINKIYSNAEYYQPTMSLAAQFFNSGMSAPAAKAAVKAILAAHPNPNPDVDNYIKKIDNFLTTGEFNRPVVEPGSEIEYAVDSKGRIEPSQENVLKLLSTYQLRYDNFRAAYMGCFDGEMRVLRDADYARIQLAAEKIGFKRVPTALMRENVILTCESHTFDSAIEWGKSLKWDGVERCKTLLPTYFGSQDNEYTRAASMYIASAMGGRLMEPGCKADAAIVLVGDQGVGKTVAIQALAPMDETFVEINLATRDSDQSRQLRGKLIGELGELRGLRSREAEDIKSWMSRTSEEWIPKYQEFSQSFKRRLTFWGSTNEQQFLNDVTGNRRWIPIKVKNPAADKIKEDRDQIWAEAIHIFTKNGVIWKDVQALLAEKQEEFFDEDPLVDDLRSYLELTPSIDKHISKELWEVVRKGVPFNRKESHLLSLSMKVLGWERKAIFINGKTYKGYQKG